jgi:hypothetical protein
MDLSSLKDLNAKAPYQLLPTAPHPPSIPAIPIPKPSGKFASIASQKQLSPSLAHVTIFT